MPEDSQNPDPQTLDQSEIDKLLAGKPDGERQQHLFIKADGSRSKSGYTAKVESYDFRNPVFLSEIDLRRLRQLHEDFIRFLSARLSLFLRMEFSLKMAKLSTQSYVEFTGSLPSLTHLCLFKAEPLVGVGVLEMNPRLALTIVDRLLGGRGHSVNAERYLTEIEIGLLEGIATIVLEEWCRQWKSEQELHPTIVGHENSGQFLRTASRDAIFLTLRLDATFGDCAGQIQVGIPFYTIEPMVKRMQAKRLKDTSLGISRKEATWQKSYERINVPVRAQWNAFELTLREITSLRVGDVIEMPADLFQHTRLLLNGMPKFVGAVGIDDNRVAVQITTKLPPEEEEL